MPNVTEALAEIEAHRMKIDALDGQIVALLNERETHSLAIRELKPFAGLELFDPTREDVIFDKVASLNKGPIRDEGIRSIYATLLKVMKETPAE